jgi:hypothetical protein
MIPNTSYNVATVQVSALPIQISQIEGYFKGATANRWLQVHDSCIAPAANAVPLWEMPINQTSQFQETLQVARLVLYEGCFIGVSSTEGTWTASADTMDITVWTDTAVIATNAEGDKTTVQAANTAFQIWTSPNPSKKLYQLIITDTSGATNNVKIFGDAAATIAAPYFTAVAANATWKSLFGSGWNFMTQTLAAGGNTLNTGCYIYPSGTCTILAITN